MSSAGGKAPRPGNVEDVCNPYNDENSARRRGVMVSGDWDEAVEEYIEKIDARALYVNVSKGWKGTDFRFLSRLRNIEELNLIASKCEHLEAIEEMYNLQSLSLTCDTASTVDFSRLPKLTECYLLWWPGAASIFNAVQLERAYLDGVRLKDFTPLGNLRKVRHLTIANANIENLDPLLGFDHLERLELLDCKKLSAFDVIGRLISLKRLTIRGSKALSDLSFLGSLKDLEVLILSDNGSLASLEPLRDLHRLKAVAFAGSSTIDDGDLTVLTGLERLSMLMFAPRRHYSHKLIKPWNWRNFDHPDTLLEEKGAHGKRAKPGRGRHH